MTEKGEKFGDDEDFADITAKLVGLGLPEKMKMVYDAAKIALKKKQVDEEAAAKVAKSAAAVPKAKAKMVKIGDVPEDIFVRLAGNSAEKITSLEKDYDFSKVSVREQEEATKLFHADKPTTSRQYGSKVLASYMIWLKWNYVSALTYKGHLVRSLRAGEGEESDEDSHKSWSDKGEENEEESYLIKFKVLEIRFPVDNGDEAPDPSMHDGVMTRVWEAMDEAGVWEVITEELGWLCEGVCERIVEAEREAGVAM